MKISNLSWYKNGFSFYFQKHKSFSHTTYWLELPLIGIKFRINN